MGLAFLSVENTRNKCLALKRFVAVGNGRPGLSSEGRTNGNVVPGSVTHQYKCRMHVATHVGYTFRHAVDLLRCFFNAFGRVEFIYRISLGQSNTS